MKLPALLLSDPHFTSNARDEYRWKIWPWLRDQLVDGYFKTLLICGDLTDAKDYHSATLVNRLVREISATSALVDQFLILQGNHDYLKAGHAFFEFLSVMPKIQFIVKPLELTIDEGPATILMPHSKNPAADWQGLDFSHFDLMFIHQTIKGAKSSNGTAMEGEDLPKLNAGKIWSGDIHVPQVIGPVEYIGSPYHVHFGDSFIPRCVELDRKGKAHDLHFPSIRRRAIKLSTTNVIRDLERLDLKKGDQAKLTLQLSQAEAHEWAKLQKAAAKWFRDAGIDCHGIQLALDRPQRRFLAEGGASPLRRPLNDAEAVLRYVEAEDLGPDALDLGLEVLK